jgi:hypothetical protein
LLHTTGSAALAELKAVAGILDEKAPEDAAAFKAWLLSPKKLRKPVPRVAFWDLAALRSATLRRQR